MRYFNQSLESGIGLTSVSVTWMPFAPCILSKVVSSHSGIISGKPSSTIVESELTTSCYRHNSHLDLIVARSTKVRAPRRSPLTTHQSFSKWAKGGLI